MYQWNTTMEALAYQYNNIDYSDKKSSKIIKEWWLLKAAKQTNEI